ncbi:MAG: hypothetical protein DMF96_17205 [Acidobacteria bacterium]|nr:MAG: hypothetical protein DMF96_17205 [Acidobacteriota bacterium]
MKCSGSDPTFVIEPSDFVTIAMLIALEGLLSADNAMVLAVLVLGLPKGRQRKALRYGMAGAFVFRSIATLLAKYLIQLGFVKLLGGGYLLYLVYRHFGGGKGADDRRAPIQPQPWLGLTAFWATVVKVELTDVVFVMMRLVIGHLLSLVERYPPLVDGAFVIIAWVALKLLVEYLHAGGYIGFDIPKWVSLGLIVVIFAAALAFSLMMERKKGRSY